MSPSSSPSTIPASTARRSPPSPGAIARATCARSLSETPPIPPRLPTIRQSPPCSTTWTPRRASQPRSSKPSSAPRGAPIVTRKTRMAPCGGERPTGSSSRTRSRSVRESNSRTSAGTRSAKGVFRTGPVTTVVASPERPISGASTLRSRASSRTLPHHQPTRTSASAQAGRRISGRHRSDAADDHDDRDDDRRRPHGIGERDPDAGGEDEKRRPAALDDARDHGETRSRSCSTRAGPIPGIASRSSTERKPPWAAR